MLYYGINYLHNIFKYYITLLNVYKTNYIKIHFFDKTN